MIRGSGWPDAPSAECRTASVKGGQVGRPAHERECWREFEEQPWWLICGVFPSSGRVREWEVKRVGVLVDLQIIDSVQSPPKRRIRENTPILVSDRPWTKRRTERAEWTGFCRAKDLMTVNTDP